MKQSREEDRVSKKQTNPVGGEYDIPLLFTVLFLVGIGIVMVYSASSAIALKAEMPDYFFLKKQAMCGMMGLVVLVLFSYIPYHIYRTMAYPILALAFALLAAILATHMGHTVNGAARWLRFGGLSFQPSEFARFALVVYLAYSLTRKQEQIRVFSIGFLPHVMVLGALSGLIYLQPDFGSILILCAVTWLMLYVAGVRILHLLSGVVFLLPVAYFLTVTEPYRLKRYLAFLDPWQYPSNEGYQIIHSLMAFGSGGILGAGIGKGYQKLFYLPYPHTDFIFSVIGEELGLIGIIGILILYCIILWRGVLIARRANDCFGAMLAVGLTTSICFQVCTNMAVTLGLLPTKGLTLPFISFGGTSLLMSMAMVGVLMNIGKPRIG